MLTWIKILTTALYIGTVLQAAGMWDVVWLTVAYVLALEVVGLVEWRSLR